MNTKKLEFIDSLRGLAALFVLLFHLTGITTPSAVPPEWLVPFAINGGSGVFLFFIVSAFTLCLSLETRETGKVEPLRNFYIRRLFRIAPLFYVWLVIYYIRDILYYHTYHSLMTVVLNVVFLFNLVPNQESGYVWASWTIGVEMLFYIIFPVVFFYVRNFGVAFFVFLIATLIRIPWHALVNRTIFDPSASDLFYVYSVLFNVSIFLFGVFIYHVNKLIDFRRASSYGVGYAMIGLFVSAMLWENYSGVALDRTQYVFIDTFYYGALLIGLGISPLKFFVNHFTRFYGKISYSVYLAHPTIIFFMSPIFAYFYRQTEYKTLAFGLSFVLALAVITPISYLTFRYVEQPGTAVGRMLIRNWGSRRRNVTAD